VNLLPSAKRATSGIRQLKARSHSKSVADPRTFAAEHRKRVGRYRLGGAIAPMAFEPKLNEDAMAIENRLQALSTNELLARYHELVDKRLEGELPYTEYFEIERIEARLDTDDQGEISRMTALQHNWRRQRTELVASIERLLAGFEATR
jgi:hypothetical protein